jgi:ribosomal protein S15P/S13E
MRMRKGIAAAMVVAGLWSGAAAVTKAQTMRDDPRDLAMEGRTLTAEEAENLELHLKNNPDDLTARTKLLGYYMRFSFGPGPEQQKRTNHVLWVIEHHPEAEVAGFPEAMLDPHTDAAAYAEGRATWLKRAEAKEATVAVLGNAASFFQLYDRPTAEDLLSRAEALEPENAHWAERLGHLYDLDQVRFRGQPSVETAKKALAAYERALDKIQRSKQDRLLQHLARHNLLQYAARAASQANEDEKATAYATELLNPASSSPAIAPALAVSRGNAIHYGNLVLGEVALRHGDIEKAEQYLIAAGKTPGSPNLDSFGPNMYLAQELLKRGRSETVIEYVRLCGQFWKREKTEAWITDIKAGRTPDFGANLTY